MSYAPLSLCVSHWHLIIHSRVSLYFLPCSFRLCAYKSSHARYKRAFGAQCTGNDSVHRYDVSRDILILSRATLLYSLSLSLSLSLTHSLTRSHCGAKLLLYDDDDGCERRALCAANLQGSLGTLFMFYIKLYIYYINMCINF